MFTNKMKTIQMKIDVIKQNTTTHLNDETLTQVTYCLQNSLVPYQHN